ncbi:hypothetical protein [Peptostreptococcus porci]|uniref:hypothetical protein n=1 Tax=Peptostreptococcus porci TaxID=2652282 RepID=UPI002A8408A7|nr:hypothetical protein [Peptostreptococcus porci]MDY4128961.1 hypothetical protein [Peptostreptococcus porci]
MLGLIVSLSVLGLSIAIVVIRIGMFIILNTILLIKALVELIIEKRKEKTIPKYYKTNR